jgi:hypothetical protein
MKRTPASTRVHRQNNVNNLYTQEFHYGPRDERDVYYWHGPHIVDISFFHLYHYKYQHSIDFSNG